MHQHPCPKLTSQPVQQDDYITTSNALVSYTKNVIIIASLADKCISGIDSLLVLLIRKAAGFWWISPATSEE